MKTTILKRSGIAYDLATTYGKMSPHGDHTICSYRGFIFRGFLNVFARICVWSVVLWFLFVDFFSWLAASIAMHTLLPMGEQAALVPVMLFAIVMFSFMAALVFVCYRLKERHSSIRAESKSPSAIQLAYRSWREKSCVPIKFEGL